MAYVTQINLIYVMQIFFIFWNEICRLMHVTDWIPTLLSAISSVTSRGSRARRFDGIDVWSSLTNLQASPRTEMLYNIDPFNGDNKFGSQKRNKNAAIRVGSMKLIVGGGDAKL